MATRLDRIIRQLLITTLIAGAALALAITALLMLHRESGTNEVPALTAQIKALSSELASLRTAIEAQTRLTEQQDIAARTHDEESRQLLQSQVADGFADAYASQGIPTPDAKLMGAAAAEEILKAAHNDPAGTVRALAGFIKGEPSASGSLVEKAWEAGRNAIGLSAAATNKLKDLSIDKLKGGLGFVAKHLITRLVDVPFDLGTSVLEEWLKKRIFGEPAKSTTCCCASKSSTSDGDAVRDKPVEEGSRGSSSSAASSHGGTSCIPDSVGGSGPSNGHRLQLAGSLYFDSNRFQSWRPDGDTWNRLKAAIQTSTSEFVLLRAITDTQASSEYNLRLAEGRAATVRAELTKAGVAQHRIFVAVNGEAKAGLKVPTQDEKSEQANRVVDVFLERRN